MKKTALITGSTNGIGLALAKIFAAHGYDLVLVARKQDELNKTAVILEKTFQIAVKTISKDLSTQNAPQEIYNFCQEQNIIVNILVNNAAMGVHDEFKNLDIKIISNIIELNMHSLTLLIKLFLPGMLVRKEGKILNLASIAAFQPGPFMATYYASKAYVLSLSQSLHSELKPYGISVTVLAPGAVKTGAQFFDGSRLLKFVKMMEPEQVAKIGFDALMKNKAVIIPGFINKLLAFLTRLGPLSLNTAISGWTLKKP